MCIRDISEADCSQMIHRLLCLLLLGEQPSAQNPDDSIARSIRYMNQHLFESLSVQQVCLLYTSRCV